jgi:hypothetical protein
VTVCRVIPLVAMLAAVPLAAGAQFGGMPGLPGGPPPDANQLWPAPPLLPPVCQQFLALRKEAQTQLQTLSKAIERQGFAPELCKLLSDYLAAETKYIREIEAQGSVCGTSPETLKKIRETHAMFARRTKQACEAARTNEQQWPLGDHWLPSDRLPGR